MKTKIDSRRRRFLVSSAAGSAAAGLAGFAPGALARGKPVPGYATGKDADRLIVHSNNTMETVRDAVGTSGVTGTDVLFVRNNLAPPESAMANPDAWEVELQGVTNPRKFTVGELKSLGLASVAMVLQCSGNGRGFFGHKVGGTQWKTGAAGSVFFAGVPVKTLVDMQGGVRQGMRYMTSTGGEVLPSGVDPKRVRVERSVPWTEMENAILAWELNGDPLPLAHGGPLRVVIPGYFGVNNVKYVKTLAFTENETDTRIQSSSYRMRGIGQKGAPSQPSMWQMNLKSYVTGPSGESPVKAGMVQVHGVAFSGASSVKGVEVSVDGGKSWKEATLYGPLVGPYAWRTFVLPVKLGPGKHMITSRAIGFDGAVQPELRVENERGYGHNGWRDHAVEVTVA